MTGRIAAWAGLVGVYLLVLESTRWQDLVTGAVVAAGVLVALRRAVERELPGGPGPSGLRRALALPRYVGGVLAEVTRGTRAVGLVVLGRRPADRAGVVRVPLDEHSHAGAVLHGHLATLSPGELLLGIDWDARELVLHVLDASDPDALRAKHAAQYADQARVLP